MPSREPQHGDVYRNEDGGLLLFVRTEACSGRNVVTGAEPGDREHVFVGTTPRHNTAVYSLYLADERPYARRPMPEALELVVNAGAEARIAALEETVSTLTAEKAALAAVMKLAVGALPMEVAAHLRKTYRDLAAKGAS